MPCPKDIVACSIGRQLRYGLSFPAASPGKPRPGAAPKPTSRNISHIDSAESASAIFAAPTLEDFWMTCATVSELSKWASWMVAAPMLRLPGAIWITESGLTRPPSRARATVKGLSVEPGSKVSVSVRFRSCAPASLLRLFGLRSEEHTSELQSLTNLVCRLLLEK